MIEIDYIKKLSEEKLTGSHLFLAEVLIKPGNRIHVFLDGERGVTIEDCSMLSRHLNKILGETEDYELTVSSFGADQPLVMPRQYIKNIGRSLTVKLADEQIITGILQSIQEEGIHLKPEIKKKKKKLDPDQPEQVFLRFDQIVQAKVNISFN